MEVLVFINFPITQCQRQTHLDITVFNNELRLEKSKTDIKRLSTRITVQ